MEVINKDLPYDVRFGIELEIATGVSRDELAKIVESSTSKSVSKTYNYRKSIDNDFWDVKVDTSCGIDADGYGYEVASYIAKTKKDLNDLLKVTKNIKSSKAKVGYNCGFHIHFEVKDQGIEFVQRMAAWWCKIEHIVMHAVPLRRKSNYYCKSLVTNKLLKNCGFYDLFRKHTENSFWNLVKPNTTDMEDKKHSLNFLNYACFITQTGAVKDRPTLELRLPEGTLSSIEVKNWVLFVLSFHNFVLNINRMPDDISPAKSIEEFLKFIGLVSMDDAKVFNLSKDLNALRNWMLKRICSYTNSYIYLTEATQLLQNFKKPKRRTNVNEESINNKLPSTC